MPSSPVTDGKTWARPPSSTTGSPTEYYDLSRWSFAFWWLILLGVHGVAGAYNAIYARFYWDFQVTYIGYAMADYSIGLPPEKHHIITYVHVVLSAAHTLCALWMVGGSLWRRQLVFSPRTSQPSSTEAKNGETRYSSVQVLDSIASVAVQLTDRRGFFGVNGRFFHPILLFREMVETILQTAQAVRMSAFLPRMLLNRFYVVLLVLNCWSSILIYSPLTHPNEARRRFIVLVFDCAIDLMASMGVVIMVMLNYVEDYAPGNFDWEKWSSDEFIAELLNEAQIVLVVSWMDLASRVTVSLGLIISTTNMKELLRCRPVKKVQVAQAPTPTETSISIVGPQYPTSLLGPGIRDTVVSKNPVKRSGKGGGYGDTGIHSRCGRVLLYTTHVAFALWGFVVLLMHIYASFQTPLLQCKPEVSPMAGAVPSCYKADINCYAMEISASLEEMEREFARFDRTSVRKLVIRHCPALELPDSLQDFALLSDIRIYNSTIVDWAATASITNTNHPLLYTIYVSRVNTTDGLLPIGFQSSDFPKSVAELSFCVTNLRELPDDLDTKWNLGMSVYFEYGQLTAVPLSLIRLQLFYLILSGNPISELPSELFEVDGMLYVGLGRTQIRELPRSVANPAVSPPYVDLTDTGITFFWSWVDPLVEAVSVFGPMFLAGGSPYCAEVDSILLGEADNFSVLPSPEYSEILMNATEENRERLLMAVDCAPAYADTYSPLGTEDALHAIS